jgi:hypothetical protein
MTDVKSELDRLLAEGPQSVLESSLIAQYLLSKGYLVSDLKDLPEQTAKSLMKKACLYAALKLAEIEARAKLRRRLKG